RVVPRMHRRPAVRASAHALRWRDVEVDRPRLGVDLEAAHDSAHGLQAGDHSKDSGRAHGASDGAGVGDFTVAEQPSAAFPRRPTPRGALLRRAESHAGGLSPPTQPVGEPNTFPAPGTAARERKTPSRRPGPRRANVKHLPGARGPVVRRPRASSKAAEVFYA